MDKKRMIDIADKMYWNPELPLKEFNSTKLLQDYLSDNGFIIEAGVADMPTSFIATWGTGKPVIGFLAEFDALANISQKPVPYKDPVKEGDPGHGCGHNLYGTASAAAAIELKGRIQKENLTGTIKVLGTPAEEICVGKPYMAKAGCFDGYDAFICWHPLYQNCAAYGSPAAYDSVRFTFKGVSAYGGQPWKAKSAFDAAMLMDTIFNAIREHILPPEAKYTCNGTIKSGNMPTVIPDYAEFWYVFRSRKREFSDVIYESLNKAAQASALATGTEFEVYRITGCHDQIASVTLNNVIHKHLVDVGAPVFTEEEQEYAKELQKNYGLPMIGLETDIVEPNDEEIFYADDRSEPSWFAPMGVFELANWPVGLPAHGWGITAVSGNSIGYKCMDVAAEVMYRTAVDLIKDPEILKKAKEEFQERTVGSGREFKSPIPDGQKPPIGIMG